MDAEWRAEEISRYVTFLCCLLATVPNKTVIDPKVYRVNYLTVFSSETEEASGNEPKISFIKLGTLPQPTKPGAISV